MPRPMVGLKNREEERSRCCLSLDEKSKSRQTESVRDPMLRERVLRKKRSKRYMDMMCKLDTGNTKLDSGAAEKLIDGIRAEFPEIEIPGDFIGIVSKCWLGKEYEVHTLSLGLNIVTHYKFGEPLPDGMDCARNLAASDAYAFIEVYTGCIRTVSEDGMVSVIKR